MAERLRRRRAVEWRLSHATRDFSLAPDLPS